MNYVDFEIESFDVVLVSYEILRERHGYKILCQNHWHRIVLDECQELKCSTSLIASQCSNLKASYRFVVHLFCSYLALDIQSLLYDFIL